VKAGNTGTTSLNFTGVDNFAGQIHVACALPPAMKEASCSASPAALMNTASASSTVTIVTAGPHPIAENVKPAIGGGAVALAGCVFLFVFGRKRLSCLLGVVLLVIAGGALSGCGGGSGGSGGSGSTDPGTPTGSYTVKLTAVSNNITRTASFTVTVQ